MTTKEKHIDQAWVALLLIRCGFMGKRKYLTAKGRGLMPMMFWRVYVKTRCELDRRFRRAVLDQLKDAVMITDSGKMSKQVAWAMDDEVVNEIWLHDLLFGDMEGEAI